MEEESTSQEEVREERKPKGGILAWVPLLAPVAVVFLLVTLMMVRENLTNSVSVPTEAPVAQEESETEVLSEESESMEESTVSGQATGEASATPAPTEEPTSQPTSTPSGPGSITF